MSSGEADVSSNGEETTSIVVTCEKKPKRKERSKDDVKSRTKAEKKAKKAKKDKPPLKVLVVKDRRSEQVEMIAGILMQLFSDLRDIEIRRVEAKLNLFRSTLATHMLNGNLPPWGPVRERLPEAVGKAWNMCKEGVEPGVWCKHFITVLTTPMMPEDQSEQTQKVEPIPNAEDQATPIAEDQAEPIPNVEDRAEPSFNEADPPSIADLMHLIE